MSKFEKIKNSIVIVNFNCQPDNLESPGKTALLKNCLDQGALWAWL